MVAPSKLVMGSCMCIYIHQKGLSYQDEIFIYQMIRILDFCNLS